MNNSTFTNEDDDIVCLQSDNGPGENVHGWINIGVHSVKLEMSSNGDLTVELFARGEEHKSLSAAVTQLKEVAVAAGGIDPDEEVDGTYPLTVDAIDYTVGVTDDGDCIEVLDHMGNKVANAEHDHADGALHASFYCAEDGHMEDHDARQSGLYRKSWREVATWLCAAHPNV